MDIEHSFPDDVPGLRALTRVEAERDGYQAGLRNLEVQNESLCQQLEGAVSALREIASAERVENADPLEWATWAHDLARDTLTRLGEQ